MVSAGASDVTLARTRSFSTSGVRFLKESLCCMFLILFYSDSMYRGMPELPRPSTDGAGQPTDQEKNGE